MPSLKTLNVSLNFYSVRLDHVTHIFGEILASLRTAAPNVTVRINSHIEIEAISFTILDNLLIRMVKEISEIKYEIHTLNRIIPKVKFETTYITAKCPYSWDINPENWLNKVRKMNLPCLWRIIMETWVYRYQPKIIDPNYGKFVVKVAYEEGFGGKVYDRDFTITSY